MIAAGAGTQSITVITALINFFLALTCVKAPGFLRRIGLSRKGILTLGIVNSLVWVPLILTLLWASANVSAAIFAVLWLVNLVPATLLAMQVDYWLAGIIPSGTLGRYLGQRQAVRSVFYIVVFCLLGYFLDRFSSQGTDMFLLVFIIALIAALGNTVIFRHIKDSREVSTRIHDDISPRDFLSEVRRSKLNNYFLFTSLFYVTVNLCGPLYIIYMLNDLHFSYVSFTVVISLEFLARIISAPFWGRYADKVGNIRIISIASWIITLLPFFWLFYHHVVYLSLVQIASGVCWGAFDLCTQAYIYRVAPAPKRLCYITYNKCLHFLCIAGGGLLGALLYEGGLHVFGSSILGIFLLSGIFRLLVSFHMVPKLIDMSINIGKILPAPVFNEDVVKSILAAKRGLYYHPPKHTRTDTDQSSRVRTEGGNYVKGLSMPRADRSKLSAPGYRKSNDLNHAPVALYMEGSAATSRKAPVTPGKLMPGLFYDEKKRTQYWKQINSAKKRENKITHHNLRKGLYRNNSAQELFKDDNNQYTGRFPQLKQRLIPCRTTDVSANMVFCTRRPVRI